MEIYTIGFTQRSAEEFFGVLRDARVRRLIDTRLNNTSQLAAFAKRDDLAFFLNAILEVAYHHEPLLAPTAELLNAYRKKEVDWATYEVGYLGLLRERSVSDKLERELFDNAVLLCSERTAERCHRRLAAEYLAEAWTDVRAVHL